MAVVGVSLPAKEHQPVRLLVASDLVEFPGGPASPRTPLCQALRKAQYRLKWSPNWII